MVVLAALITLRSAVRIRPLPPTCRVSVHPDVLLPKTLLLTGVANGREQTDGAVKFRWPGFNFLEEERVIKHG